MRNTNHRHFQINVLVFAVIGLAFYALTTLQNPTVIRANPLYSYGAQGLYISVIGFSFTYYYFRFSQIRVLRSILLAVGLYVLWFACVIYIGSFLKGHSNVVAAVVLTGVVTFMFFAFLGAINGIFGFWIALANLVILGLAVTSGQLTGPLMWASLLTLVGIDKPVFQWFVVVVSVILGLSDKGYSFFVDPT